MKTTGPGKVSLVKADGTVVELGTFDGLSYQVVHDVEPSYVLGASLTTQFYALLRAWEACPEAIDWLDGRGPQEAWSACPRGSWLVWWAQKAGVPIEVLRPALLDCTWLAWRLLYLEDCSSYFALEGFLDAIHFVNEHSTLPWVLPRLLRTRWPKHAENHDADDNGDYGSRVAAAQATFADIVRRHIPEVPWP